MFSHQKISRILFIIVIMLIITIGGGNVYANGLLHGVTIENQVSLKESTSEGSNITTILPKGVLINILDVYGTYVLVTTDDQWGWVHKNYVFIHDENFKLISYGNIKASKLNVRSGPGLEHSVIGSLLKGDDVFILKSNEEKDWLYVKNDIIEGWIYATYTTETYQSKNAIMSVIEKNIEISRGDTRSEINYMANEEVELLDYQNGWYYIKRLNGTLEWLSEEHVNVNIYEPIDNRNEDIAIEAKKHLGKPYKWGANGPNSFDCSGYTKYVFSTVGKSLPRVSRDQAKVGEAIGRKDLRVGDLVFFDTTGAMNNRITHVGIYIGNNEFIHASSSKTGKYVRITSLSKNFYNNRFVTARRIK